ncbi:MAG: hypothetical protein J6W52_04315 [Bacteroidaceae bacterium]|nr:hypothetical protein [Bacteroidaceae bacterium]
MKKYISPETIVVTLHVKHAVLQTSVVLDNSEGNQLESDTEILTKGVINNKSVWDEEW